jgi:hypothetical protein
MHASVGRERLLVSPNAGSVTLSPSDPTNEVVVVVSDPVNNEVEMGQSIEPIGRRFVIVTGGGFEKIPTLVSEPDRAGSFACGKLPGGSGPR